jgi:putative ABC transport system permease protein
MKTSLAWYNLAHNPVKTAVAVAGVTFAVVLMFLQLGFLEAVRISATLIYEVLEFDLCLKSPDYLHLADARTFPEERLAQAIGVPGVESALPLIVANNGWRNSETGQVRSILCLGVRPREHFFSDPAIQDVVHRNLDRSDSLLIDRRTRPEYGPVDGRQFGPADVGREVELSGERVRITGLYERGAGLTSGGAAILTDRGLRRVTPGWPTSAVSLGLVRLKPDADPVATVAALSGKLADDVEVVTRDELLRREIRRWVYETNYGLIFQTGVAVAVIVGIAIVYQVLSSDVASLLPEYATLKSMGYGNRYLASLLLQQAVCLASVGYVVGIMVAGVLYEITALGAKIPIRMTWQNAMIVAGLTLAMCVVSAVAAVRKAFQADPADLF